MRIRIQGVTHNADPVHCTDVKCTQKTFDQTFGPVDSLIKSCGILLELPRLLLNLYQIALAARVKGETETLLC